MTDERQRIDRVADFIDDVKQQYIPIINRMMDLRVRSGENILAEKEAILGIIERGFIFDSALDFENIIDDGDLFDSLDLSKHRDGLLSYLNKKGAIGLTANLYKKLEQDVETFNEVFARLKKIYLTGKENFVSLDLSQATNLEEIILQRGIKIGTLIFPNSASLKRIFLQGQIIHPFDLNLSNATNLEEASLYYAVKIGTLNFPNSASLKRIFLLGENTNPFDLNLSNATNLEEAILQQGIKIGTLNFPNSASLKRIFLLGENTNPFDLNLSQARDLEEFKLNDGVKIGTLILPELKRNFGDKLPPDIVDKLIYVNPDGIVVDNGDGSAFGSR